MSDRMDKIHEYAEEARQWCETCDNMYLPSDWDSDARMCVYCAVTDLCETCDNMYAPSDWDSDARMCVYCAVIDLMEDDKIREFGEQASQADIEVGRKLERERIIALLQAEGVTCGMNQPEWELSEIVALIKGENE